MSNNIHKPARTSKGETAKPKTPRWFIDEVLPILIGLSELDSGPEIPGDLTKLCDAARAVLVRHGLGKIGRAE
jgi:hypothetical protein